MNKSTAAFTDRRCSIKGHKWFKPHPNSSAWDQPEWKQPPRKCERCGVWEDKNLS